MNETVSRGMNEPETAKWLAADGADAAPPDSPVAFQAAFAKDYDELAKQIRSRKVQLH